MTDDTGKHYGAYHGTPEQYWETRESHTSGCRGCAGSRKASESEKKNSPELVYKGYTGQVSFICDQGVTLDQGYPWHTKDTCPVNLWRKGK